MRPRLFLFSPRPSRYRPLLRLVHAPAPRQTCVCCSSPSLLLALIPLRAALARVRAVLRHAHNQFAKLVFPPASLEQWRQQATLIPNDTRGGRFLPATSQMYCVHWGGHGALSQGVPAADIAALNGREPRRVRLASVRRRTFPTVAKVFRALLPFLLDQERSRWCTIADSSARSRLTIKQTLQLLY